MNREIVKNYLLNALKKYGAHVMLEKDEFCSIRFDHWKLASIRICEHEIHEPEQFIPKFQIRMDFPKGKKTSVSKGLDYRMEINPWELKELVDLIKYRARKMGVNPGDKQTWAEYRRLNS